MQMLQRETKTSFFHYSSMQGHRWDAPSKRVLTKLFLQGVQLDHPILLPRTKRKLTSRPCLYAIDDYSVEALDFKHVMETIQQLELKDILKPVKSDFVGASEKLNLEPNEVDLIWFDAKSDKGNIADFLLEYWDFLHKDGGILLVHFTAGFDSGSNDWWRIDIPQLLLKLKLVRAVEEVQAIQLIEPHKYRQGAVTMVKRTSNRMKLLDDHPALKPAQWGA